MKAKALEAGAIAETEKARASEAAKASAATRSRRLAAPSRGARRGGGRARLATAGRRWPRSPKSRRAKRRRGGGEAASREASTEARERAAVKRRRGWRDGDRRGAREDGG